MNRLALASLFVLSVFVNAASAVDIKNIRSSYGPLGATRTDSKFLPGDIVFMMYDLDGLAVDPKSGKTKYEATLEFIDANDPDPKKHKVIFKKPNTFELAPALGTGRMPGDVHVILGPTQAPGKYAIKCTIIDKNDNNAKAFRYDFEVLPQGFGFVMATLPPIGLPGQNYIMGFGVVNLALDGKGIPNTEVTIKLLDDKGVSVAPAMKILFPRDLPTDDAGSPIDLKKSNAVPITYPIYFNRPGRFTVEIQAHDKFGNKKAELRYPVTALDINNFVK